MSREEMEKALDQAFKAVFGKLPPSGTDGDINDWFEKEFPLEEFVHFDLPNDYDPVKIRNLVNFDFASAISRASLGHRTWYVPVGNHLEFMKVIDSGLVCRKGSR